MRYEWTDPNLRVAGPSRSIEAEIVEFTTSHVVFRDYHRRPLLALRNDRVDELHPVEPYGAP